LEGRVWLASSEDHTDVPLACGAEDVVIGGGVGKPAALFLAIELVEHLIVASASLLRWSSRMGIEHFVDFQTISVGMAIGGRAGRARLVRRWGSSIIMTRAMMR
jgi:hypothetical protein